MYSCNYVCIYFLFIDVYIHVYVLIYTHVYMYTASIYVYSVEIVYIIHTYICYPPPPVPQLWLSKTHDNCRQDTLDLARVNTSINSMYISSSMN